MYRQDYLLRLIEQVAQALAALRARITGRSAWPADTHKEIAAIAREGGLDLDVARSLDANSLMMWLAPMGDVDPARFWLLGELLLVAGLQLREEGQEARARADFERARAVFGKLAPDWRPHADLTSAGERISEIQALLVSQA